MKKIVLLFMLSATKNTYDYLVFLKIEVAKILANEGDLLEATDIDQSKFNYLTNHASIARKNAAGVFQQLEFQ